MKETIAVKRQAHLHLQLPEQNIKSVLIAIHGYGQKAEDFLSDFYALKSSNVLVVAPEGLSKFYNKKSEAVASWMTSHERLDEIKDYCAYLNDVYQYLRQNYNFDQTAVLGFSQGVSTAMRWLSKSELKINHAYLCAGSIPPELKAGDFKQVHSPIINYYHGDDDRLLPPTKADEQIKKLKQLQLNYRAHLYEGRHIVPEICMQHIRSELTSQ